MLSLEEIKSKTKYQVRGKDGKWYAGSLDYIHSNCPDAAPEEMDADFDVVEIENKGLDPITKDEILRIVIQSDDLALVGDLAVVSNRIEAEEVFGK